MASILLQDANLDLWQVQIIVTDGEAAFQSAVVTEGIAQVIVLVADAADNFQLGVDLSGNVIGIPSTAGGINAYVLGSSDCSTGWNIVALPDGDIDLVQVVPWNPGPVVGQIFPLDNTVVRYTQPGGIGTQTFPQQQIGEMIGLFVSPCGHWHNGWVVQSAAVCGVQSAVITCPLCSYVVQIITPFDLIYTAPYQYIIG